MAITHPQRLLGARAKPASASLETRVALVGALVCVASVAMAAAGASSDAAFGRGLLQLLIVGGPIAVGLYALRAPVNRSFGIALLGIGFAWSLTALAESTSSVPHTIGRLATWLTLPGVVYLLLAFPQGRIDKGFDRAVFVGVVGVAVILFYGTAPFVQAFPPKTLWATCSTDCPRNALFVLDRQPALLTQVILIREWLVELLWLGLFYSMFRRWRAGSPRRRRMMGPAFVAGTLLGIAQWAHITARQLGAPADTVVALSSAWTFCIVGICAGFLLGLAWSRMTLAGALEPLAVAMRTSDDPTHTRDALATALGDSTAQLLIREPGSGGWHDAHGRPVDWPPSPQSDRAVTFIEPDGARADMAIVHDVALLDDRELLDGVSSVLLASLRHEQLTDDLGRATRELEDSRRRIAEAADHERARIERDLHDGAQQRLVALRIRLGIAEELLISDPDAGMGELHELGSEVERALEELRSLATDVYPSRLTDGGLARAVRSAAAQAPLPVHIIAVGVTRHPIEIESAVYFTCLEALQNTIKHGDGASGVWIKLAQSRSRLRFEVRDDGPGFTLGVHDGRGLRNMHDRIEALGGDLTIDPEPGRGTRILGSVPL